MCLVKLPIKEFAWNAWARDFCDAISEINHCFKNELCGSEISASRASTKSRKQGKVDRGPLFFHDTVVFVHSHQLLLLPTARIFILVFFNLLQIRHQLSKSSVVCTQNSLERIFLATGLSTDSLPTVSIFAGEQKERQHEVACFVLFCLFDCNRAGIFES